jgi:uncharacterized protein YggE
MVGLGLLAVLAVIGLAGCQGTGGSTTDTEDSNTPVNVNVNSQQQGIWVNGTGKVSAAPDLVTITLGVSAQEATVAQAQAEAADAMSQVMQALKDSGVAPKDIQTQYFSVNQVTSWDEVTRQIKVDGYQVSNTVTAKVRVLDKAGTIIDAVAAAGGNFTRINGISFSIEDPMPYYQQAREKAIADAKSKAAQMASLTGVTLGKVTYVTENSYVPVTVPSAYYKDSAVTATMPATTSISPGEMEINANVQVVYSIS